MALGLRHPNILLTDRGSTPSTFVQQHKELRTQFSIRYSYQRTQTFHILGFCLLQLFMCSLNTFPIDRNNAGISLIHIGFPHDMLLRSRLIGVRRFSTI